MPNLSIKNETVYVIYRNGQPVTIPGRKLVYTTMRSANGVITEESENEARRRYDAKRMDNIDRGLRLTPEWWRLRDEEANSLIDKVRREYEVVEYVPKCRSDVT